jgi:SNF2 family DNA or RNA helicase
MRMACNSIYLIDRRTHISPKFQELEGIIDEMVVQSGRKMVIFSEWTTMTYPIGRYLSEAGIRFVELSGKIEVKKRQALIDEFSTSPKCRVFLSTDAGGTGLNLQAADCVVNIELPWNPAKVGQRIGRVNRIGRKSRCINVVNLITKNSIEEKILAGLQLKTDLFTGVFDGGIDTVEFMREKRAELLDQLHGMLVMEPLPPPSAAVPSEELPGDTLHFLNPEALKSTGERVIDVSAAPRSRSK